MNDRLLDIKSDPDENCFFITNKTLSYININDEIESVEMPYYKRKNISGSVKCRFSVSKKISPASVSSRGFPSCESVKSEYWGTRVSKKGKMCFYCLLSVIMEKCTWEFSWAPTFSLPTNRI